MVNTVFYGCLAQFLSLISNGSLGLLIFCKILVANIQYCVHSTPSRSSSSVVVLRFYLLVLSLLLAILILVFMGIYPFFYFLSKDLLW